jgi:type I restriction enzyme S subunit
MSVQIPLVHKTDAKASKVAPEIEEIVGDAFDMKQFVENFDVLAAASGGVQQLKHLVLELGASGKLVPQSDEDGLASELFTRIQTRRGALVRTAPAPFVAEDLPPIPRNWIWTSLDSLLVLLRNGVSTRPEGNDGVPVLRISAVRPNAVSLNEIRYLPGRVTDYEDFFISEGDLLFTRYSGNAEFVGACGVVPAFQGYIVHPDKLIRGVVVEGLVEARFISLVASVGACRDYIDRCGRTTAGQVGISGKQLKAAPIPLAPLAEQKRIVAKVDQLMGFCDELEARQVKKRETGTWLTKSALEALTNADGPEEFDDAWRRVVENFDVLIDRAEKVRELRRRILALAVTGRIHGSVSNVGGSRVGDYVTFLNGYAFKSEWFANSGVPLLRNVNVGHGRVRWDDVAYLTAKHADEFSRFALSAGDVVVSLDRPIISTGVKVARVRSDDLPCLLLQRVGKVVVKDPSTLSPDFFFWWLNSPCFTDSIDPGRSNGVPHISTKDIEALSFFAPSSQVQTEIVRFIERFLGQCDELEDRLRRTEDRAAKLVEAVVQELVS